MLKWNYPLLILELHPLMIVNFSPQRPQGMDCVYNSIGKIDRTKNCFLICFIYIVEVVSGYDHPSPNLSSDYESSSSFSKIL